MLDEDVESLISAYRAACMSWDNARAQWQDSVALEFERDCWSVFSQSAEAFISAMAQLEDALDEAESVAGQIQG